MDPQQQIDDDDSLISKKEVAEELNESEEQAQYLKMTKEIVNNIKSLEDQIRQLEKEEERDMENETTKKREFSLSFKMISDKHWKIIVGVIGLCFTFYLVDYVINLVSTLLRGSGGGEIVVSFKNGSTVGDAETGGEEVVADDTAMRRLYSGNIDLEELYEDKP